MKKITISIVIPVFSGREYLKELVGKIAELRGSWEEVSAPLELLEVLFVNDASSDGSLAILEVIKKDCQWVRVINLSRNFGQHQATIAGILHSSGDWVVTLDEDLQHDPAYINKLVKTAVTNEMDIVYACPDQDVHESYIRDWSSRTYKKIISVISGNKHIPKFNSFRLIRGTVARASGSVCTHGTYYDIVLGWFTESITSIELPLKDKRFTETGKSGYSLYKLLSHARKMVVSSEAKIVRLGAAVGFAAVFIAVVLGLKIYIGKIIDPSTIPVRGWTSLYLTLLSASGLIAILLGIVLEYISIILLHIQGKPVFFVVDRSSDSVLRDYFSR